MFKTLTIGINIVFLLSISTNYAQDRIVKNIVFEGAGIRGIAYTGVISCLEQNHKLDSLQNVAGTSAGAITALMLALGYHSDEIGEIIANTKFQKFNDGNFFFIGGIHRMKNNFGWYRTDKFEKWLENIIETKTQNKDITFIQLKNKGFKNLFVTATCLNQQKLMVFSAETYPNMKVKDAVRISMSIPYYFNATFIDNNGNVFKKQNAENTLNTVVDGGILGNYPIFIFDKTIRDTLGNHLRIPNMETLGIRIDSEQQIKNDNTNQKLAEVPIQNIVDFTTAFYNLVLESLNRNHLEKYDWQRTISVSSVGISPKIKKLTSQQKTDLINSGKTAVQNYFITN